MSPAAFPFFYFSIRRRTDLALWLTWFLGSLKEVKLDEPRKVAE
jgi:hypothetical protein